MVEEFLDGEEASFFVLLDGSTCLALASAQVGLQIPHWYVSAPLHFCAPYVADLLLKRDLVLPRQMFC